jgi:type IV secretory pathway TraG/TraD family ATPase VirD4
VSTAESRINDPNTGAEKFFGKLREMAETPSINAKSGGVSFAQVIEEGGCVYIVGSMRNDIVKTAQRILLVRLIQLAERRDRMAGELRKICIVLDEVKYHLSRPALEGLGAARDKGVHLVLAHQSLGDLKDCSKDLNPDAVVDAVVENCRVKVCYKVQSPDTAKWLATMSGTIQVDDESRNVKKNMAQAETIEAGRSIRQADRYFIDENMLLNLPPSVAVLYGSGLPTFVSIQPLKVTKSMEAVRVIECEGGAIQSTASKLVDLPSLD